MRSVIRNLGTMLITAAIGTATVQRGAIISATQMRFALLAPGLVFVPEGRGCGRGYFQTYRLPDGSQMVEGSNGYESPEIAEREFRAFVAKASNVIEHNHEFTDRFGQSGERFVLIVPNEGQSWGSIVWYGGDNVFTYIAAPSLDVARTFERANAYAF